MSIHLIGYWVYHNSSIRYGLILRDLSLVTTKLIATSIIGDIVARFAIAIICTLTFVSLILSLHLRQLISHILRYIEPLVWFKTIRWMSFINISIDACNLPFIIMMSIRIPISTSFSSLSTAFTTSSLTTSSPSTSS